MLQTQPNVINNKKALFCSRAFLQKPNSSHRQDFANLRQVHLLKFFPKYIHYLRVAVKNGPIISRVKRVKILHILQGHQSRKQSENLRRTLLCNKEKHIQDFYQEKPNSRSFLQEIKTFKNLKSLRILSEFHSSFALKRVCQYAKGLSKLKHLELKINSKESMNAISMIDSYKRLLDSLITLKIDCTWRFIEEGDPQDNMDLFRCLVKNKNFLKSATSLKLGALKDQVFHDLFENTLASCPKLVSLLFETDNLMPDEDSLGKNGMLTTDSHYLRGLGNLNHLHTVNIECRNIYTFLRDFVSPPSIQNIKLAFSNFEACFSLLKDPNNWDFSEICSNFYEKWSCLANLKTLDVAFSQRSRFWPLTLDFLQSWLKKVCNLQNLDVELSSANSRRSQWSKVSMHEGTLDFSIFLQSIQHLRDTLQTLILSDNWLVYSVKNLPKESFGFPHLEKFCLRGFIRPKEINVTRLFEVNLKDSLTTKLENQHQQPFGFILEGLNFDSADSFIDFMKSFDYERSDQQRALKMKMIAYVTSETPSTNFFARSDRYFTLQGIGFNIQMKVNSNGKFEPENDPKILLPKNLNFLRLKE